MIPKKIHYCWLSGDPFPELIARCIESWEKYLPDYEFILWDTNRFNMDDSVWVSEAFETKKYAFAADYIRLYAVYHHGGIYLDTDIEVLKSFNDLLHLPYFLGSEGQGIIEAGVFGAEKNTPWIAECLKHYDNRAFIKIDGSLDQATLPRIMMQQVKQLYILEELTSPEIKTLDYSAKEEKKVYMFPQDYFCAKNHGTGMIEKTENTYSIHHFAMSWVSKKRTVLPNIKRKLMGVIGVKAVNNLILLFGFRKLKRKFKRPKNN
ncbi:glycosyltransferase [Flavobacteriaceae bacterium 3-367]